jgi:RNA polymerase sigma-70 factor (ECF subfamily)
MSEMAAAIGPSPSNPDRGEVGAGSENEETRWAREAREGNLDAFECLYRGHVRKVYGLCLRMTANSSLAEELTQEAFVRAWEKLSLFEPGRSFSAWLRTLTVNVVFSEWRSRKRRSLRLVEGSDAESKAASAPSRSSNAAVDLERAVAQLPPRARMVFVLHDVEGYRHEEIGRMIGIAVGTSKAQLHRARRLLREELGS